MHLYDFITDETQYELKKEARSGPQVFELNLEKYQTLFFKEFDKIDSSKESDLLHQKLKGSKEVSDWFLGFDKLIKVDRENLVRLFDDIREVYQIFLTGNFMSAVMYLHHLLEKYDLLDEADQSVLGCFLRGRWFKDGDDILNDSFFYHIPFTERYKIGNQRFSFNGHPLLYTGQSLISVFYELKAENLDEKQIAACLMAYNHFADLHYGKGWEKIKRRGKIYDITNSIYETVNDTFFRLLELDVKIPQIDNGPSFPKERILREFRKLVLSHCSTFPTIPHIEVDPLTGKPRNAQVHFVEEYVLPQLLTQAVKLHKYNGILYPSTKVIHQKITVGTDWNSNIYRTNLAMFTEYKGMSDGGAAIDLELFEVLKVDTVNFKDFRAAGGKTGSIGSFNAKEQSEGFIKELRRLIKVIYQHIPKSEISLKILNAFLHIEKKVLLYKELKIDDVPYLESLAGKMEYIYLEEYFKFVNSQFRQFYRDILDTIEIPVEGDG